MANVMAEAIDLFDETADEPKAWYRLSKLNATTGRKTIESAPAFAAFRAYCTMGSTRSIRLVARALGKSAQLIARWSSHWNWQERVRAYDNFVSEQETAAFILERRSMARRQAQLGVLGQNIAATGLVQIQEQLQAAGQKRPLKVHEIARLLEVSSRLERLNRGEHDPDAVASIVVHIERQKEPRWKSAGCDADDAEKSFDA
jgi:hypothetical protein